MTNLVAIWLWGQSQKNKIKKTLKEVVLVTSKRLGLASVFLCTNPIFGPSKSDFEILGSSMSRIKENYKVKTLSIY